MPGRILQATVHGWWFVAALLAGCVGWIVLYLNIRAQAADGARAHTALCAFRSDLSVRHDDTVAQIRRSMKFLHDNPHGIPGIPAALLRESLRSQQRTAAGQKSTLQSLDDLRC